MIDSADPGIIAGVVIAGVVIAVAFIAVIVFLLLKRPNRKVSRIIAVDLNYYILIRRVSG